VNYNGYEKRDKIIKEQAQAIEDKDKEIAELKRLLNNK
jgi:hypothetical protein